MFYRKDGNVITVRPEVGEDIVTVLKDLCKKENIHYAHINGIGGVKHVVVGCYSHAEGQYIKKTFDEDMEMLSLSGNVSFKDGEPYLHMHAVFSGTDCVAVGGHLFEAVIGITGEIFVTANEGDLDRIINPSNTNLTILDI